MVAGSIAAGYWEKLKLPSLLKAVVFINSASHLSTHTLQGYLFSAAGTAVISPVAS
jgi:hypothetical protein